MPKISFASHPYLLGFEQLERLLERTAKADGDAYPPYNIEQSDDGSYRITLAVAGFGADDLSVTVEESQLVIRGQQIPTKDREVLHQGIALRQFQRVFVLADCIEVEGAFLENGLLHMDLARIESKTDVQKISITKVK
ncbi:MAG: Hsp20 family protein [Alphaproteobacteria bacterium]